MIYIENDKIRFSLIKNKEKTFNLKLWSCGELAVQVDLFNLVALKKYIKLIFFAMVRWDIIWYELYYYVITSCFGHVAEP